MAPIQALRRDGSWLIPASGAPADVAGVLAVSPDGHCVFHHGDRCEVHRTRGPAAMPSACQHFPREVLVDPRGVFVTLSHYCPTAADLLFTHDGPVEIVEGPPVLPAGEPEGLDARSVLPPLLVDGVLMDLEGYGAWEAHMVRVLTGDDGRSPEAAVARLTRQAIALQRWRPGTDSLADRVGSLAHDPRWAADATGEEADRSRLLFAGVIRRFLAAHAFASWMPYEGSGLGAVVGSLHLTLTTLRQEIDAACSGGRAALSPERLTQAIRRTDLRLVHLTPRAELARAAGRGFQRAIGRSSDRVIW